MKIKLILENYDKEKIAEIQKMKETLNDDDFFYQMRCLVRHDEKNFDAIYYATPNGAELLAEVENYLHDHLIYEVRDYYAAKMAGHDY
jgi:hypothetical protein